MKKYPFLEAMSAVDEKFLEEVLNDTKEQERRRISMNKKRTATILVAAALVVTMAATAVAAGVSKISTLGDYFEGNRQYFEIPDEVPIMRNPEDYANEVTASTKAEDINGVVNAAGAIDNYTPPAPGEAKVTAVSASKRSLFITYEFNAAGLDLPQELPDDARPGEEYQFEWVDVNFMWSGGGAGTLSRNGDIFTGVAHWNNIREFSEDEIVFKLQKFGYTAIDGKDKVHKTVADIEVEMRLPVDQISIMESIESTNTAKLMDSDSTAELSPYELIVYTDIEQLAAAGYNVTGRLEDEGKEVFDFYHKATLEIYMLDGTVFTEHLFTNDVGTSHIVGSMSGFRDDENGRDARVISFDVPLDVAKVDYITINDARFDFASTSPKTDSTATANASQTGYTPPAPGEAKILAVSATKYNMYMTVEFNVAGLDLPKELPEDSSPTGQWYFGIEDMESNFRGGIPNMELMSYENDIMTYGFWFKFPTFLADKRVLTEEERAQDELILKLKTIGYTAYSDPTPEGYTPKGYRTKEYKAVRDVDFEIRVPLDEIEIMEPIRSTNTATLMGVDGFTIELSPYDMDLCTSFDNFTAAGIDVTEEASSRKMSDYLWGELYIEFHMLDGSSFYEDFTKFTHNIINGGGSGANIYTKQAGATYGFWVPLDVSKIDYITINDARFDFAH